MRTVSEDERDLRTALVDAEILLDAMERYPLRRDLGWQRFQMTALRVRIANLRRQVHVVRALTERADTPASMSDNGGSDVQADA